MPKTSKVSVELYINNEIRESFVADIPNDKLDTVCLGFIDSMSELIYKYEIDDLGGENVKINNNSNLLE